jgi:hypothetical protein
MEHENTIARYRNWYRKLLGLYSRPYRERFAESMEQTFHDLCCERASAGKQLTGFVLWTFVETSVGIFKENARTFVMQNLTRRLVAWAAVVAVVLIVPVLGNRYVDGWNWTLFDFVCATVILFGAALTFELVARKGGTTAYRSAVGIAVTTGLLLVWINGAVGIIGDAPINLLYFGIPVLGFVGGYLARFQPRGMAWTLVAMAVAQMMVPTIALVILKSGGNILLHDLHSHHAPFHPGVPHVFALNAVFAAAWIVSALLFRHAAGPNPQVTVSSASA